LDILHARPQTKWLTKGGLVQDLHQGRDPAVIAQFPFAFVVFTEYADKLCHLFRSGVADMGAPLEQDGEKNIERFLLESVVEFGGVVEQHGRKFVPCDGTEKIHLVHVSARKRKEFL
jgi:hypothetical protein